jgi:hypothetical protein
LKETKRGNKYIVVGIDYLTKIVELEAIKEKTAEVIGNFIYEKIILNHSCPNVILSDNGKEFNNEIIIYYARN